MGKIESIKDLEQVIKQAKKEGINGVCVICMAPATVGRKCYCDYDD